MARKPVQVQRFTNADQLAIGQKARFIGADGLEYETSPIAHFDVHPDGRISITTQSGSTYGNFDFEAQRIKDNAEWEARLSPEQKARSEEHQRLYQLQAQNKMNQMQQNTFNEDFAQYVVDRLQEKPMVVGNLTAFDPNTMRVWKDNQWQQPVTMQDFQSGACLYFGNVEFEHLLDPQLHESQPNFQIQIRECGTTADGYFWMDTGTHILSNAPREGLEQALQEKFHEFEQTQSQEAQDPTDIF